MALAQQDARALANLYKRLPADSHRDMKHG